MWQKQSPILFLTIWGRWKRLLHVLQLWKIRKYIISCKINFTRWIRLYIPPEVENEISWNLLPLGCAGVSVIHPPQVRALEKSSSMKCGRRWYNGVIMSDSLTRVFVAYRVKRGLTKRRGIGADTMSYSYVTLSCFVFVDICSGLLLTCSITICKYHILNFRDWYISNTENV